MLADRPDAWQRCGGYIEKYLGDGGSHRLVQVLRSRLQPAHHVR